MDETGEPAAPAVPSWAGWAVVAALFVLVGGCTLLFRGNGGSGLDGQHRDATRVCEGFVKDRILGPAGAEFSDEAATGVGTAAGGVTVTGTVDAVTRQHFRCQVVLDGSNWRLDALTLS